MLAVGPNQSGLAGERPLTNQLQRFRLWVSGIQNVIGFFWKDGRRHQQ